MGSSAAHRQRRYRMHKAGDHRLCLPDRGCPVTPSPVTRPVTPPPPERGPRGERLWRDEGGDNLTGARRELLEEACRLVDRLDRLDGILKGDPGEWMRFRANEDGTEVTVTLDRALAESRQQAVALKQIVAELRQGAAAAPTETGGSVLDQLAARREARRANATG